MFACCLRRPRFGLAVAATGAVPRPREDGPAVPAVRQEPAARLLQLAARPDPVVRLSIQAAQPEPVVRLSIQAARPEPVVRLLIRAARRGPAAEPPVPERPAPRAEPPVLADAVARLVARQAARQVPPADAAARPELRAWAERAEQAAWAERFPYQRHRRGSST